VGGDYMKVSSDFSDNSKIPSKYTCDGKNVAPRLIVSDIPSHAKVLVLIVDDSDAPSGTWVHWTVFDVAVSSSEMEIDGSLGKEGLNDFGNVGYGGPCPPSGMHHYHFKVYALGAEIGLARGASKKDIEAAMKGEILAEAELIGIYQR
jgi:Raf kinase inhibitor-like YbhB/YbcL family protein